MKNALKLQLIKLKYSYKIILAMMGLTVLMIFLFSGNSGGDYKENIAIINADETEITNEFVELLNSNKQYSVKKFDENLANEKMKNSEIIASIILPDDFTSKILTGNQLDIEIVSIKSDISINLLTNMIKQNILSLRANEQIVNNLTEVFDDSVTKNEMKLTYKKHLEYKRPFNLTIRNLDLNANNEGMNHSVIGFCIFFVSYSIVYSIADILEDIEKRTWHRAIVSPIGLNNMIYANNIISFLIGYIQMTIIFIITSYVFKLNFIENFFSISVVSAFFVFALVGISTFVVSLLKSFKELDAAVPIVLTSMAMLGGCLWPLEIVNSKILLFLSNLTPHKWAILGIKKIVNGNLSLLDIKIEIGWLFIVGLLFYLIGIYRMNKRVFQ
jgi:ABC-2 type transport system permease protein